jgi:hypothetical protein
MRAIGDSESMWFVGVRRFSLRRGEGRRCTFVCVGALPYALCRSGEVLASDGGAAGNLKVLEKELEAFRVMGSWGVLGVVVVPVRLLPGRAGNANSLELSWTAGGDERPMARGEGCVADRWPGELAVLCQLSKLAVSLDRTWIGVWSTRHDLQTSGPRVPSHGTSGCCALLAVDLGGRIGS